MNKILCVDEPIRLRCKLFQSFAGAVHSATWLNINDNNNSPTGGTDHRLQIDHILNSLFVYLHSILLSKWFIHTIDFIIARISRAMNWLAVCNVFQRLCKKQTKLHIKLRIEKWEKQKTICIVLFVATVFFSTPFFLVEQTDDKH